MFVFRLFSLVIAAITDLLFTYRNIKLTCFPDAGIMVLFRIPGDVFDCMGDALLIR